MLNQFISWYEGISRSKNKGVYAPHKPISILFALTKVMEGKRWIEYNEDRNRLEAIIGEFTKYNSRPNCLQPLGRLVNDSKEQTFWQVIPTDLHKNQSGDFSQKEAKERELKAGFSDEIYSCLNADHSRAQYLIGQILEDNFPESLHDTLISLLGIDLLPLSPVANELVQTTISKAKRDPMFPKKIMAVYDNKCAFCGLKLNLETMPVPMEAAHIKWKSCGGSCSEDNGLSLCPTHHFTFDRGLWTIDSNYEIELSDKVRIQKSDDVFFSPFIGKAITRYIFDEKFLPDVENIHWHRQNILK